MSFWLCPSLDLVHQTGQLQKPGHRACAHLAQLLQDIERKRRGLLVAEEENKNRFHHFFGIQKGLEKEAQKIPLTSLAPVVHRIKVEDDYHKIMTAT